MERPRTTIREDTPPDNNSILNLDNDYVLEFSHNNVTGVVVDRYHDVNGDGVIDANETATAHVDTIGLDQTHPLWEAGKLLSRRAAADRTIYTVVNTPNTGNAVFGPFNDGNSSTFSSLLGSPLTFDSCLGEDNATRRSRVYPSCADDNCTRRKNLINYVRGTDAKNFGRDRSCRKRTFTDGGQSYTWKLGDIVYSTPKDVINYMFCYDSTHGFDNNATCTQNKDCPTGKLCKKKESVIFTGANDGMLHAFKTGIINNEPNPPTVASLWPAGATDFGKELWAFIPKNVLPYLRWLAAPGYCHLSYVDLSPFITTMTTPSGKKRVLIGGLRFGGAPAPGAGSAEPAPCDTCASVSCSNLNTCYNPAGCTGLSSYFALDITNPEKPIFLWEFSHPQLGYSYSGPAVITRKNVSTGIREYFVMFLNGPTGLDGSSTQNLQAFILTLNSQLQISSQYVADVGHGNSIKNAIGGRLFTTGVDLNEDGDTDFVFFGESDTTNGNLSSLKGGVVRLWINGSDPTNSSQWDFTPNFLNLAKQPITAKVEVDKCFDRWYLFMGSGRYFTTTDNYPSQRDFILAVPFYCTNYNDPSTCTTGINYAHGSKQAVCTDFSATTKTHQAWYIDLADANGTIYYKERLITDPTISAQSMVFFTTTQPLGYGKPCESGGHTRVWGLNCATGEAISDNNCTAAPIADPTGTIYLQTSTGAINKIVVADSFTEEGGRTTQWIEGIPPESSTPFVGRFRTRETQVMHWIEK